MFGISMLQEILFSYFSLIFQIWLTAKKQNVKAATYFWVGSDVAINGMCSHCIQTYLIFAYCAITFKSKWSMKGHLDSISW